MKCSICKKKLTIVQQQIICKCKIPMCPKCKNSHKCVHNYRQDQRELLEKTLEKIKDNKIKRI